LLEQHARGSGRKKRDSIEHGGFMQAELDELLALYRMMDEKQKQQLIEAAKELLEAELKTGD